MTPCSLVGKYRSPLGIFCLNLQIIPKILRPLVPPKRRQFRRAEHHYLQEIGGLLSPMIFSVSNLWVLSPGSHFIWGAGIREKWYMQSYSVNHPKGKAEPEFYIKIYFVLRSKYNPSRLWQDGQWTYNVTLRCVPATVVAVEKENVRVCVRSLRYPQGRMHALDHTVISGVSGPTICFTLFHKWHDFGGENKGYWTLNTGSSKKMDGIWNRYNLKNHWTDLHVWHLKMFRKV